MGRHSKDWNDGYQAAIEAIKQALQGGGSDSGAGQGDDSGLPSDMTPPPGGNGSGSGSSSGQGQQSQGSGSGSGSRTDSGNESQGVVRPEDCASGSSEIQNTPGRAGGMISKAEGDKLAQSEGYDKEGGNEGTIEKDWKDAALKAANDMKEKKQGDAVGRLKSTIEGLYKVSTDWKKALKYVVGKSINPEDRRQAYANKNILISQDRIARTDKDKYDNMDYLMCWVDSSGSMSDEQLKMCLSEVYAVALAKKPMKIYVIQCDTQIHEIKMYKSLRELKNDIVHQTVKGRGGTDLKPCWDIMKTDPRFKRGKPDLVMVFTDGYLTQYKRDARTMNTLCWCIIDNPSFKVQYNDTMTRCIHLKSDDIR